MNFEIINAYYQARGLGFPDQRSALLFFLSEVGELAQAYAAIKPVELCPEDLQLLETFSTAGMQADEIVSRKPGWVRNHDRVRKANIADEVVDCEMMLAVFMHTFSAGESNPDAALLAKMERKLGRPIGAIKKP